MVVKEGTTVANTTAGSFSALRDDLVCDFVQKTCLCMLCVCICVYVYMCVFMLVNERTLWVGVSVCVYENERDVRNAVEKEDNTLNPESVLL